MKQEFPVSGPQQVYVELQSGAVTVTATTTDRLAVEVTGAGADSVVVDHQGDRLSVLGRRGTGFLSRARDVSLDLTVPQHSHLAAHLGSAAVTGRGALGAVDLTTGSGEVSLDRLTGPAQVKTGSGDIRLSAAEAPVELKTGSGDIRVTRLSEASRLATGSGSIEVEDARSVVALKSGSGDLTLHATEADASLTAASGELRVGRMTRGRAELKNASGDIYLGVPAGTPVWTDVSTSTGQVRSTLAALGAPAKGQDYVEVRARTVTGDVVLEHLTPAVPAAAEESR